MKNTLYISSLHSANCKNYQTNFIYLSFSKVCKGWYQSTNIYASISAHLVKSFSWDAKYVLHALIWIMNMTYNPLDEICYLVNIKVTMNPINHINVTSLGYLGWLAAHDRKSFHDKSWLLSWTPISFPRAGTTIALQLLPSMTRLEHNRKKNERIR